MSASHGHEHTPFDGMSDTYKRRLWMVIFINEIGRASCRERVS
jgi:hypothetical protein